MPPAAAEVARAAGDAALVDPVHDPLQDPLVSPTAGIQRSPAAAAPSAPAPPPGMAFQADSGGGTPARGTDPAAVRREAMQGVRGSGSELPHRGAMERYFGGPLDVRAHTGAEAQASSRALGARAYTVGRDIAFGSASPGPELVAHELTHVAQQARGVRMADGLGRPGDAYERQADAVAAGLRSGRPASDFLGDPFPGTGEGGAPAVQRKETPGTDVRQESFGGVRSSGKTQSSKSFWREDSTVETETSHEGLAGARSALEHIKTVDNNTILRAVQVLALAGAFGERAGKIVLKTGSLELGASGKVGGRAGAKGTGRVGVETVEREIDIDGKVIKVIDSIKLLAKVTAEAGAGGDIAGKLEAAYGKLGAEAAGKLTGFVGLAGDMGGSVTLDRLNLGISAALSANGKIGLEVGASGSVKIKFGSWVSLSMSAGVTLFVGARANAEVWGGVSLRKFFTWSLKHQDQDSMKGFEGDSVKAETEEKVAKDTTHDINYGADLGAKFEAMAGAEGKQEAKLGLNVKNVGLMNITEEITGLAGAKMGANARVALAFHTLLAEAKAEAFAGLKAQGKVSLAPITYKGRALIKLTAGAQVYLGAGASAEFSFKASKGKIKIYGKAAAALGFGFGFDVGLEVDITVILEAIKDVIAKAIALIVRMKSDQRRAGRGMRVGKYLAEGRPELPPDTTEAEVITKVRGALAKPFADYESKKALHGKHGIKREGIQKRIDDESQAKPVLEAVLPTKAADKALHDLAMDTFGQSGVLKKISFRAGVVNVFEIDEVRAGRQKKVRSSARKALQKYKTKKGRYGEHGAKASRVKEVLNELLGTLRVGKGVRATPEELQHDLGLAAREIFGQDVTLTFSTGRSPVVTQVDLHAPKEEEEERTEEFDSVKEQATGHVKGPFQKINDKNLKKRGKSNKGLWFSAPELTKVIGKKALSKMIDTSADDCAHNLAIVAGIEAAFEKVFGLAPGKVRFEVYHSYLRLKQFPDYDEIKAETPAAYHRYLEDQVSAIVTPAFTAYAQKKATKGSHFVQLPQIQKKISKVDKFLGSEDADDDVVKATVLEKAQALFGKEYVFKLAVKGGKKKRLVLDSMELVDDMLHGQEQMFEARASVRQKAHQAVLPGFMAYADKKTRKGANWIKKEPIQKVLDKRNIGKFLPRAQYPKDNPLHGTEVPKPVKRAYADSIVGGLESAALEAFGLQHRFEFGLTEDGESIEVKAIKVLQIGAGAKLEDLSLEKRAALLDIEERAHKAVRPPFETYAAKGRKKRNLLTRKIKGHQNWIDQEQVQKLVDKSKVKKFLDTDAPDRRASLVNQAVLRGVDEAAKSAFGSGRQVMTFDVLGDEVWLRRMQQVRRESDGDTEKATSETRELAKKAVLPGFREYAEKKTKVKTWRQLLGVPFASIRSRHWIKQEPVQKAIEQADLGRYLDPLLPFSKTTLANIAVQQGVEEAATTAFPPDYVAMTFEIGDPSIRVKSFELKDKAIRLKLGSNLYYEFNKYQDSFKFRWHMKRKSFHKVRAALKKTLDSRIPDDYKGGSLWREMVGEVGVFVFKDQWPTVIPL